MARVLTTEEAKQAITRLKSLISDDFMNQIHQLDAQGRTLSQPDVWDGPLAEKFRQAWHETKSSLDRTQQDLEELRQQIETISANIMQAGGGN